MAQLFPDEEAEIKANEMVVVQHELSDLEVLINELKQYEELAENKKYSGDITILKNEQYKSLVKYTMAYYELLKKQKDEYFQNIKTR